MGTPRGGRTRLIWQEVSRSQCQCKVTQGTAGCACQRAWLQRLWDSVATEVSIIRCVRSSRRRCRRTTSALAGQRSLSRLGLIVAWGRGVVLKRATVCQVWRACRIVVRRPSCQQELIRLFLISVQPARAAPAPTGRVSVPPTRHGHHQRTACRSSCARPAQTVRPASSASPWPNASFTSERSRILGSGSSKLFHTFVTRAA